MKTFEFISTLSKKDIYLAMKNLTDTNSHDCLMLGNVTEEGFSVIKNEYFTNNVLNPEIKASFTEDEKGTHVNVRAFLNKKDKIGFSIMAAIILCIVGFLIISAILAKSGTEAVGVITALLGFLVIVCTVFYLVFILKTKKVVNILKKELLLGRYDN